MVHGNTKQTLVQGAPCHVCVTLQTRNPKLPPQECQEREAHGPSRSSSFLELSARCRSQQLAWEVRHCAGERQYQVGSVFQRWRLEEWIGV